MQDMLAMRSQIGGQVNVEVDAAPQQDLNTVLSDIREHYETVAEKNRKDLDAWYLNKVRPVFCSECDKYCPLESEMNSHSKRVSFFVFDFFSSSKFYLFSLIKLNSCANAVMNLVIHSQLS